MPEWADMKHRTYSLNAFPILLFSSLLSCYPYLRHYEKMFGFHFFHSRLHLRLVLACVQLSQVLIHITFSLPHMLFVTVVLEMEMEIYESELADYSLQDSPFYEANTPIIFGLTTASQTSAYGSNQHHHHHSIASKVDGLNLTLKKSSMKMMSTKCQQQQSSLKSLAFERSPTNGIGLAKTIDANDSVISKKSRSETMAERLYADKCMDADRNSCSSDHVQPKKKRKCVSFLPNFVQVRQKHDNIIPRHT